MDGPLAPSAVLRLLDAEAAARAWSRLAESGVEPPPAGTPLRACLDAIFAASPYVGRLACREPETFAVALASGPGAAFDGALDRLAALGSAHDEAAVFADLRRAKRQGHLAVALGDLCGVWPLDGVTGAMTRLAEVSVAAALQACVRALASGPRAAFKSEAAKDGGPPGYVVLGLGKLGAGELNVSSDVDLVTVYDRERLAEVADDPAVAALKLTRALAKALGEITADGYVFRVDLRLRPDPGATPVAISTTAALNYYESVGQTWERAAYIKARPIAGDLAAGTEFLDDLSPFIWRRSLDHAAIADIDAMMRQVQTGRGGAAFVSAGADLKRAQGGIRQIEFFAQGHQLLLGGRRTDLRLRGARPALAALAQAGVIAEADAKALDADYVQLRSIEHRIQLVDDEPTQTLAVDPSARAQVAALAGAADLARFDADLATLRRRVHAICGGRIGREAPAEGRAAPFVFGVDEDPALSASLTALGYADPQSVLDTLRSWAAGRPPATRSERARALLPQVARRLIDAAAETGAPDEAFARFVDFFERLPAGVQILSMFEAEPRLFAVVVKILALAPRLAPTLARQPAILDAMFDADFLAALDPAGDAAGVAAAIEAEPEFEAGLNLARRRARERRFRIGAHVLLGKADAAAAGAARAALADAVVAGLAVAARRETERRYGRLDAAFAVVGLGKLGGGELAEGSDLDLMCVYDADDDQTADGPRGLSATHYFARLTQRLIAALSAETEEGELYDVDLQLRPSGSSGPIATRLSAFRAYYGEDAWTWELMALTRARVVTGDAGLAAALREEIARVLCRPRDRARVAGEVADMRRRMARERPASGAWDLKLAPGGLVDVEFAAQFLQLVVAADQPSVLAPSTLAALDRLSALDAAPPDILAPLRRAGRLHLDLTQLTRIAMKGAFDPGAAPSQLKRLLARAGGAADFDALEASLLAHQAAARAALERLLDQTL